MKITREKLRFGDYVLHKDHHIIVANKPAGTPVQSDKTGDSSLLQMAEIYTKTQLFLVNRIDRPVSGLVILAKKREAVVELTRQMNEKDGFSKKYLAVVEGHTPDSAEYSHFIKKDARKMKAICINDKFDGYKACSLSFVKRKTFDNYSLIEVQTGTGRFHQIRAQLATEGFPIKGDVKYGARRKNKDRSIHLHAWQMEFSHPSTGESMLIEAPLPSSDILWQEALK